MSDELERMLRQAQIALAKADCPTFIELVLGRELAAHHKMMLDFALELWETRSRGVILAPRNAAKTTILNTGMLSWLIGREIAIRIGLFSQKDSKAEAMSSAIQGIIDTSEEYKAVFGDLHGIKWTAGEWHRKNSPHVRSKDRTMVTGGAAQSSTAVSKRFDMLFFDDILDENNTATIDQREKIETWFFKSMLPTQASEGAAVLVVGTRWVEGDLYQKLIEENKWKSLIIPAISTDDDEIDTSYWPEVWPLERLYAERLDVGWDNFACSYLNTVTPGEGVVFKRDWWKDNYFFDLPPDRQYVFTIGIDLASSMRERADYTTAVLVAQDDRNEHWVLWHERTKTDSGHREFVIAANDWARSNGYPVSRIVIENNQHQSTLVQDLLRETQLPVVGRRADVDKVTRARSAAARYESRRVHHHESIKGRELETEMLGFPKGHDDLVDGLGLAMDLTGGSGSMAVVRGGPRTPVDEQHPLPAVGSEIPFRDGTRLVPAYLAGMLQGIPTETLTYEEAVAAMNRSQLSNYINSAMRGMLPRG